MGVEEHTITIDQTPVFYRRAPSGTVPPLYLHGIPTSSDDWIAYLERSGGIAPDLPGFGRSGKPGHLDYSLNGHADFLHRLLDTLEVPEVKLVAHDWGAGGGLVFAQRHPERIAGLVLVNALPLLDGFEWPRLARILRSPLLGELVMGSTGRRLLARILRHGCVREDAWSDQALAAVWEQFDQGTQRAILRLLRSSSEQGLAAAAADLSGLAAPALVVWGENDPWLDANFADTYASRLPQAEVALIPRAGHWPWLDDASVIDRVVAFLQAIP